MVCLKRIHVTVTTDQSEKILETFEKLDLPVVRSTGTQDNEQVSNFSALIPDELVDNALEELTENMDLRKKENAISIYDVEAFVSTALDKIKEKAAKEKSTKNPLERLINATDKHVRPNKDTFTMALFATLIAFSGLFLDNVVIVIGAMLLSPLLGPLNAFAVNADLGRLRKVLISQFSILALLVSMIALSAATTFIVSQFVAIPINSGQIVLRMHASFSDIGIALIIGLAGGLALFVGLPELLVGVAVAVALVPPATVAGIGLALQDTGLFAGALALTFVYLIGLELGSSVMLRIRGVTPRHFYHKDKTRIKFAYSIAILVVLFGILIAIVYFLNI
jgi:uncharacterized hydrophobic protein (TIGR00341 family)